jgi:hypothetical protein
MHVVSRADFCYPFSGHKAALKNPNVSEEAKEHSRQVLEEMGVEEADA